jgi:predicted HTH transcriptional regulator
LVRSFGKNPQRFKPVFVVKAIVFPGDNVAISQYIDNEDIEGYLAQVYKDSFAFVRRNLHHVQNGQGINSLGEPEIPLGRHAGLPLPNPTVSWAVGANLRVRTSLT